jgi:hypothetical protein
VEEAEDAELHQTKLEEIFALIAVDEAGAVPSGEDCVESPREGKRTATTMGNQPVA